jgi:hypothetical protein
VDAQLHAADAEVALAIQPLFHKFFGKQCHRSKPLWFIRRTPNDGVHRPRAQPSEGVPLATCPSTRQSYRLYRLRL